VRVPLLVPELPTLAALTPYLARIDRNRGTRISDRWSGSSKRASPRPSHQQSQPGPHVVTVSNATAGIELALRALRLPAGAPVLVPALTFVATATAVLSAGLTPIVADVDAESWLLTPDIAKAALRRERVRAVVPVATFGCPQDAAAWAALNDRTGIPIVIDAAAAYGNQLDPGPTCAVFSLHATNRWRGEGGFIVSRSGRFAEAIRQMTNFGINLTDPKIAPIGTTTMIGTNAKLSEYHAAVGLASLDQWPDNSARAARAFQRLCDRALRGPGDRHHVAADAG
jgi:dTDP-4-amino-4,6-dideoxygalactose transaminase